MDRQQIGVKLAIDGLNLPFKIDGFQDRLILQKAVYLAQAAGIHLGYYYHWYLYGPYCPSLTRDAYSITGEISQGVDESQAWKLDDGSLSRLHRLQDIIVRNTRRDESRHLELLAAVHFLINRKQVNGEDTKEITDTLKRFGKDFSEEEVKEALGELINYGLLAA